MDSIFRQDRDVSEKDIEMLKDYKYKPGEYTFMDNQLNTFWLAAVEYLPRDLAPNLITVYAFMSTMVPSLIFVFYDATLLTTYPAILYVLAAVGLFLYQTLDALDGKQARRINAKSPLGQLFDHGCDSFSTALIVVQILVCLKIESHCLNIWAYIGYITIVWCSNLCEHFTGVMNTSVGQIGVTEIQLFQMLLLLLTAVGGMEWMKLPIGISCGDSRQDWHEGQRHRGVRNYHFHRLVLLAAAERNIQDLQELQEGGHHVHSPTHDLLHVLCLYD